MLGLVLVLTGISIWYWQSTRRQASSGQGSLEEVDPGTFATLVTQGKPGILEFYTTSCPYCKAIEPELVKINNEHGSKLFVVKMNAEKHTDEAAKYQIPGVPTLIFFDSKGNPQAMAAGYRDAASILDILKNLKILQ